MTLCAITITKILLELAYFIIGLLLLSGINAIWLRISLKWMNFSEIKFSKSFLYCLLTNFTTFAFSFSVGFNYVLLNSYFSKHSIQERMMYTSPLIIIYLIVFSLLINTCIFKRLLNKTQENTNNTFGSFFAMTAVYYAISSTFASIIACLLILAFKAQ